MGKTKIEWTERTWNPVRGCSRVSEGCRHCYAEQQAGRFSGPGKAYEGLVRAVQGKGFRWTGELRIVQEALREPARWRDPAVVFVCSMSDLFHENLPFDRIDLVFEVMLRENRHTYQVLTKRPKRMAEYVTDRFRAGNSLPGHIWLGTSVEDQARADERIPFLLQTQAPIRFVSAEPLLGAIDLTGWLGSWCPSCQRSLLGGQHFEGRACGTCHEQTRGLSWVIVGGESGHGARPMHPAWARQIRDDCLAAGAAYFLKQWGNWAVCGPVVEDSGFVGGARFDSASGGQTAVAALSMQRFHRFEDGTIVERIGKKQAGRELDGQVWDQMPEVRP